MYLVDKKGFTLIELLVVIAIIGILSGIVLTSLNTARSKAIDARWMSQITNLRTALELYYDDTDCYPAWTGSGPCTIDDFNSKKLFGIPLSIDLTSSNGLNYHRLTNQPEFVNEIKLKAKTGCFFDDWRGKGYGPCAGAGEGVPLNQ